MMASKTAVCGICHLRQITKSSDVWCTECDEGLCLECKEHHGLSKASRNHNTIPISLYEKLPTNVLETNQFCSKHKEIFQLFCKKHDCPCCSSCVVSDHQKCQDFIKLDEMIKNIKKSDGFRDIEQTIIDMIENIQRIKIDRQNNLSTLKAEKQMIVKEIRQTRRKINTQIDNLQRALMKELFETESKETKMIGQLLKSIEKNEKEIRKDQENLLNIKEHASEFQTFQAMKQMERDLGEKHNYFALLVKSNKLNRVRLLCNMNDALQDIFNKIRKLGEIIVSTHSSEVSIEWKREFRAQNLVAHVRSMSIENLSFVLQSTVDTKLEPIIGCTLLPDGRMVFSCSDLSLVRGFNRDGSIDFDISLQPSGAFDLTFSHDNNTIAVTGGGQSQNISIIDVENRKVKETIPVEYWISGIVSRKKTLIYTSDEFGIQMINLTDKSFNDIGTGEMYMSDYVTAFGDILYYTNGNSHIVTCCDLNGIIQWEFKDESVLRFPQGISVDNAGNVYVVGQQPSKVVVFSPDGKRHRHLLSDKDGIGDAQAICYDRETNHLLVADLRGKAFL